MWFFTDALAHSPTEDEGMQRSPVSTSSVLDPGRLAALALTGLVDAPPQAAFDRATRLATTFLDVPVSLISLVTDERQFFLSQVGLPEAPAAARETPLSHSFCQYVVASGRPLIIENARHHALVRENPGIDDLGVVGYAGVPLHDRDGFVLGAFCVVTAEPHAWTEQELDVVGELAEMVMSEIELRQVAREASERAAGLERLAVIVDAAPDAIIGKDLDGTITHWNRAAERMYGYSAAEVLGRPTTVLATASEQHAEFDSIQAQLAAGESVERYDTVRRHRDGSRLEISVSSAPIRDANGRVVGGSSVATDISVRRQAEQEKARLAGLLAEAQQVAGLGSWEIGPDGWATWSEQMHVIFGLGPDQVSQGDSTPLRQLIEPSDLERYVALLEVVRSTGDPGEMEYRIRRGDGAARILSTRVRSVESPAGTRLVGTIMDVTEAREAERGRRRAERQFSAAFEHAPIGVVLVGLRGTNRDHYLRTNPAFARMLGYEPGELDGAAFTSVRSSRDADRSAELFRHLDSGVTGAVELLYLHADGHEICALVSATPVPGEDGEAPEYCVAQILDISERKRFEGQLRYLADHDALTGLYNRHGFETQLARVVAEARRYGRRGALLMLDLDGFKEVNDRFGHPVGDELVTRVAGLLSRTVRESDIVARLGGDEFAVFLHEAGPTEAQSVAEGILDTIRRQGMVMHDGVHARVTTSIGITTFSRVDHLSGEELVVEADIAMYDAKAAGRDRSVRYDRGTNRRAVVSQRHSWIDRLRDAIDNNAFILHAQPIAGICSNGVDRFELLLRLRDDRGELIPPGAFLSIAERFDMMGAIDRWVLRNAVRLLHEHHLAGHDVSFAVNLSGKTMNDAALSADLAEMLSDHPIPEGRLIIEVTETAAIVNIDHARRLAVDLRNLGCRFALDDFGAGFASFYYLKHLDFDYLKIDGEFIRSLVDSPTDQLVVRAVVEIARGLGTKTIAEWVGDAATVALLRDLGVDYGQGFHLGKPQPLDSVLPALPAVGLAA